MTDDREFLTAEEVMARLRMGRTFVYQEARRYLTTGGAAGIPCRKFGRRLRFPARELNSYATTLTAAVGAGAPSRRIPDAQATRPAKPSKRASSARRSKQLDLFDSSTRS